MGLQFSVIPYPVATRYAYPETTSSVPFLCTLPEIFMSGHTECIYMQVIFAMFFPTEAYYTMVGSGAESLKAAILKPGFLISKPGSTYNYLYGPLSKSLNLSLPQFYHWAIIARVITMIK